MRPKTCSILLLMPGLLQDSTAPLPRQQTQLCGRPSRPCRCGLGQTPRTHASSCQASFFSLQFFLDNEPGRWIMEYVYMHQAFICIEWHSSSTLRCHPYA